MTPSDLNNFIQLRDLDSLHAGIEESITECERRLFLAVNEKNALQILLERFHVGPQSRRMFLPLTVTRWREPVTVRAAP